MRAVIAKHTARMTHVSQKYGLDAVFIVVLWLGTVITADPKLVLQNNKIYASFYTP